MLHSLISKFKPCILSVSPLIFVLSFITGWTEILETFASKPLHSPTINQNICKQSASSNLPRFFTSDTSMASNNSTPPLTVDSLNSKVLKCEYAVRGEIVSLAQKLQQDL
ncbi:putative alanine transaminase [Helianthus annuus]|uniref:Alanine transaminase n=1 Tax=Helianthus annuus TaxID=4232 RepID=A0A9K3IXX7_HELAN|nr:putative alanine transaminase [Helianthus annuus]KAJ0569254.1 putative alanine transaminase [Helianthus annuus]KAJ0575697.1 putative alanine transaminase [Helianthus annuus]KAJ0583563.1 putative alanine transaminase [Helianthus annuus]KAJ0746291.1 putative alanine transaminase [Helianthus annuus]